MNWVAREREKREVNGYPRNAHSPRKPCLDNSSKKNLISPDKRPRLPFAKPRDELGLPENADKREVNGCPKNAVFNLARISHPNAWCHLTTCTGNTTFYPRFNFIHYQLCQGNQRVCLSHSTKPALKLTQPPKLTFVTVLSSLSKIVKTQRGRFVSPIKQ
jgi:hypothetical protein